MPSDETPLDALATPRTTPPPRSPIVRAFAVLGDILLNAVTVIALVLVIRYVIISPFEVKGESMEPNFHSEDLLIVDKLSYRFQDPQRGDVIVLIPPPDTKQYYVKRIVGLPGEKIQFLNGKVVITNDAHPEGVTLAEPYLPASLATYGSTTEPITIPAGSYFVLGDNREHSNDSRAWGALPKPNIVGRAWVVLWPPSDLRVVRRPAFAP